MLESANPTLIIDAGADYGDDDDDDDDDDETFLSMNLS